MRPLQTTTRSRRRSALRGQDGGLCRFDSLELDQPEADSDHLQDLDDIIEQLDDLSSDAIGEEICQHLRFDLCPECRKKFLANPLGRKATKKFNFSQN